MSLPFFPKFLVPFQSGQTCQIQSPSPMFRPVAIALRTE